VKKKNYKKKYIKPKIAKTKIHINFFFQDYMNYDQPLYEVHWAGTEWSS